MDAASQKRIPAGKWRTYRPSHQPVPSSLHQAASLCLNGGHPTTAGGGRKAIELPLVTIKRGEKNEKGLVIFLSKEEGEEKSNIEVSSLSFKRRARRGEETSKKKKKEEKGFSGVWLLLFGLKEKTRERSEIGL